MCIRDRNGKYIHLFPKDNIINNIAVLNQVSRSYSKSNSLLSISVIGHDLKDKLDINQLRKKLANYFGGSDSNYEWVKSFDIKNATIKQKTNYFDSNTFSPTKGLIIAGDHSVYGSIEGAVLSGVNASKKILN